MFEKQLRELTSEGGEWDEVEKQWAEVCEAHGDVLDDYAISSFPVLRETAQTSDASTKAMGLFDEDGRCHSVCFANRAAIKGYASPVLRIRHLLLAPECDYGTLSASQYATALTATFAAAVALAFSDLPAKHVRFHLRSPADISFFGSIATTLGNLPLFEAVHMQGAWLYLDLKSLPTAV